ncbi:Uma2 family endonuclease [Gloeobacter morelensis]|uniref:Uma2 family endonuclease n=1 Tax=Gloeobacter morelensis MG652769 TaxID=2781736 RepID=A0ABY3PJN2_9CYAN|nr:Uma2 family endonuclease [Gloeobacter morelensis]UFP93875.1 Uma2 family endonuclease [Gloeobacter morelensis MG652769]
MGTAGVRWNVRDLEVMPCNEWTRYEVIDGELFVSRAPHRRHQQICVRIAEHLNRWSDATGSGESIVNPGIIFSDEDSVIPDVIWVSRERLIRLEDEAGHLSGAPELVVEVLSAGIDNERRDREAKLKLYSIHGVEEYWIVDRFTGQVQVFRRQDTQLVLISTLLTGDELTSPLLPGLRCAVEGLFR